MNKINFLLVICIGIGLVCGCGLSDDGGGSGRTRATRSNGARDAKNNQHSADSDSDEKSSSSSKNSPGSIAQFAGKWVWARNGSGTYSSGGSYIGSNGSRFTYEFSEEGQVEFTGLMNVMTNGCQMQIFRLKTGEASFDGENLTIDWLPEKFTREDSCDTAGNYEKELPAKTEICAAELRNSDGQRQLCLTIDGEETCFSPTE